MKSFVDKVLNRPQRALKEDDAASRNPTVTDVMRYRYHHGTNLGSVFVLEQWLSPSMFVNGATGSSELDAVTASLRQVGLEQTRHKWEEHWRQAITNGDWPWLVNTADCTSNLCVTLGKPALTFLGTTIRLPVGYFTLGPGFCAGTPFQGDPGQVYINAWFQVKELVARARSHGVGVLLDFHALPGGANGDAHSGTSSGRAELWGNQHNLDLARRCLVFMAQEAKYMDGVVGLQLCNEAIRNAPGMYSWYDTVIAQIAVIDSTMPIYISDGWDLGTAINYAIHKNNIDNWTNPVIIDTHKYYTFSDADKQQSPVQIIDRVNHELEELNGREGNVIDRGAVTVFVGEYSCVLDRQTWSRVDGNQRAPLTLDFGQAQSRKWQSRAGGSCFWTYKMDWMDGGDWGFVQQTNSGAIKPSGSLRISNTDVNARLNTAQSQRANRKNAAVSAHVAYWNATSPGQTFEHWRYEHGWDVGYTDAMTFFGARASRLLPGEGGDKIGMLEVWVRKRIRDSGQGGRFVWEFEQGLRKGISDFYAVVGV
ncbi:MAG: Glucan 1,3-beta-glucosidase 3 [Peltula sp. TS41687]|nr:MAG: Glucan 1,3-beta-glucosidase 3 [Peltula sp. TS41687]